MDYMKMALDLALKGRGRVSPNPLVGAVIVKDNRVIGSGYHQAYGQLHAEREALLSCTEDPKGASIYVNLEPCCHYGKQPPCTQALIEAGIKEVFIGSSDPNPKVAGKGVEILKSHGIIVHEGYLREECDRINQIFFHYIKTGLPYMVYKYAMALDGKIASRTGESKWISGEESRAFVHQLRSDLKGIMVGIGTVRADDPMLTSRIDGGINPIRIIIDPELDLPLESKIAKTAKDIQTILVYSNDPRAKLEPLKNLDLDLIQAPMTEKGFDLKEVLLMLGARKIDSILLEGGPNLAASFLDQGLINKIYTFIGPKILGSKEAPGPIAGLGYTNPDLGPRVKFEKISKIGEDILIESRF